MTSALGKFAPMFAQLSHWERLGDGLKGSGGRRDLSDLWPIIVLAAIAGVAVYGFLLWRRRNDMSQRCNDPDKLFRELCLTHRLEPDDRRLLRQLADVCGFAQPAQVFLAPSAFDATQLPSNLVEHAEQLRTLKRQLF